MADWPRLGSCCICGCMDGVRNVLMLEKKAPIAGRGWGCLVCQLPSDGAVAVLCDDCLPRAQDPGTIKFACRGYPAEDGRIPRDELVGVHKHDMSFHR